MKKILTLIACFILSSIVNEMYSQSCPSWATTSIKGNRLYLFFPTASDNTFPEYDPILQTSPLAPFDVANLDATIGTLR
jgi:hypothetical protein